MLRQRTKKNDKKIFELIGGKNMEALLIIGFIVVLCMAIPGIAKETRVMHDVDRMIQKNAKDSEEYFKKEYGEDFGKRNH